MDGFNVTDFVDACLDDIKEEDFEDLAGDTKGKQRLEVEQHEDLSLKLAAQILELIKMKSIPGKVIDDKNPKVYVKQQVFLHKREEKLPKSSSLTLVDDKCSVVEENKQEEQTPIMSSKDPTSDLHMSQTDRILKCQTCTKSFSNRSAFTRHTKSHKKEKNFICLVCNKAFHRASHLRDHDLIHNNINRFKCELCEKTFVHRGQLKTHITQHTGFKAFSCDVCEASFTRNESLKSHMNSHTKHKSYKCNFCAECFSHKSSVRKHEKRKHLKEKPHACELCNWGFVDKGDLLKHKHRKHENGTTDP